MRRVRLAVVLVAALLFTASYALPAVGAPSIGMVYRLAKKALKTANKADRKATKALSGGLVFPTEVTLVNGGTVNVAPLGFGRWDVKCPADASAVSANIGNGALDYVYVGSYGSGMRVSLGNPSTTTTYSGNVQVSCVFTGGTTVTARAAMRRHPSKAAVTRQMRQAERAALALRR